MYIKSFNGLTFPTILLAESWNSSKRVVETQIAGANGAHNFFSGATSPRQPLTITKKFAFVEDSESAINSRLSVLRCLTIASGEDELTWVDRAGNTYTMTAECTSLTTADTYANKGRWVKPVTIVFHSPDGIWRGTSGSTISTVTLSATSTVSSGIDGGNISSQVRITITDSGDDAVFNDDIKVYYLANVLDPANKTLIATLGVNGKTLQDGESIIFDAASYTYTFAGADDYANLSAEYLAWAWIEANEYDQGFLFEFSTTGGTGTLTFRVYYTEDYVF